jgi:hypothetical protein
MDAGVKPTGMYPWRPLERAIQPRGIPGAEGGLRPTLNNVTLSGGATTGYQNGGGLFNYYGEVAIVDSTVSGNSSSNDGGGVFNQYGKVTLTHGTVSGNVAGRYGGGLSNNGEYYSQAGEIILTNATVSGNMANSDAGGVDNVNGELKLTNSTVTGNSAVYYSGGLSNLYGTVTLNGSLISGNVASQAAEINNFSFLFGPPGPVYADNYNLFGHGGLDNAAAFYGFIPGATDIDATSEGTNTPLADILDISLADNDGPTETHALVAGSPALDQIPPNGGGPGCSTTDPNGNPLANDQRGKSRPANTYCDIGAFEFDPAPPCAIMGDTGLAISTGANLSSGTELPSICSNGTLVLGARSQLLDGGSVQALDAVTLKDGSWVTGDVAANTDVILNSRSTVSLSVTAGGDAYLKARASIGGDLFTTGTAQLNSNASVDGTITEGALPPGLTPTALPNCEVNAIGGESFNTQIGENFGLLSEGHYGEVYFAARNRVQLCGEYSFHSLRFGLNTNIEITCPTMLDVAGDLIFSNRVTQTLSGSATPETVVYRIDQGQSNIGSNVNFYGTLCAPGGTVKLGNSVRLEGALYGGNVSVGMRLQFMASPTVLLED